ncbi:MAG: EexN family lipoprotein [Phenylobacterium sp.]|uniref:EexN family lipoprotein n=1 Tax=Phenylobacterium sp. TaxID=1871053 RepID=UPI0025ED3768|nr:EexN family lipoprotein [Phenylobacterium sp.]MBI1198618.1 EexN family lipoprotein [Phenylobacterium sp.]
MTWLLAVALALAACRPEPRSAAFFEAHPEVARRVADACRGGARRDAECQPAEAGLAARQAADRLALFKKSLR